MNTLDQDYNLNPTVDPSFNLNIENPSSEAVLEPFSYYEDSYDLDVKPMKETPIDQSLQISSTPQESVVKKSVSAEVQGSNQTSQATNNSDKFRVSDSRFNTPQDRATDGIGMNNRLSSGTKKPSPMASARGMDGAYEIRSNALPEWRQAYS